METYEYIRFQPWRRLINTTFKIGVVGENQLSNYLFEFNFLN